MPPKPKKLAIGSEMGARIRSLRESRTETQTRFARALGLTGPSLVSKWESGESRPTPENLARLASLCDGEFKAFFLAQAGLEVSGTKEIEVRVLSALGGRLDPTHLAFAMEMADAKAREFGRRLTRTQLAELVTFIYDECHMRGSWDAGTVENAFASARSAIHLTTPRATGDRKGKTHQEDSEHHERFGTGRS